MKDFLVKFFYLLDRSDKKNFVIFLFLLFIGGILSLLGIGVIIPFIEFLINPTKTNHLNFLKHLQLNQAQAIVALTGALIFSFWIKNISAIYILKKQNAFLWGLVAKIQKKIFLSYLRSPYEYHLTRHSSELINIINVELSILSNSVIGQFGNILNEGITSTLILITLFFINPLFTSIIFSSILISSFFIIKKLKHQIIYYGEIRSISDEKLTQSVIQCLASIKETKLYQKETFFINKVSRYSDDLAHSGAFAAVFQQSSRFLVESILVTVVLLLMLIEMILGQSSTQMLILISVFGICGIQLLPSMNRILQALANIKYGYFSLNKIYKELSYHDELNIRVYKKTKHSETVYFNELIQLNNIYFKYEDQLILKNINLKIKKNKKIAFIGPSGCGKTTLINIISGILKPSHGEIKVDNYIISSDNLSSWFKQFGYIPQMIYLYHCSIRENIAFGVHPNEIDDERVWFCLQIASLDQFVKLKCKNGLDTYVGENGIQLSGGQKQRIGIARALYHHPNILIMDEATTALDIETEHTITDSLAKISEGRTILTIAHRFSTIKNYDCIHLMDEGEIIASGTYSDLMNHCETFKKMCLLEKIENNDVIKK